MAANTGSIFSWKKDFYVFKNRELKTQSLNVFQRFFRVLGFYSDTRLTVVSNLAQRALLEPREALEYNAKLFEVVEKAEERKKLKPILLAQSKEEDHSIEYSCKLMKGREHNYAFFYIKMREKGQIRESHIEISTSEKSSKELLIMSLYERNFPKHSLFTLDATDSLARYSYSFIAKLLNDSERVEKFKISNTTRVGTGLLARKYGFTGNKGSDFEESGAMVEDPTGLTLEKTQASKFSSTHINEKLSLDCLLL